jgi:hypothetical protein
MERKKDKVTGRRGDEANETESGDTFSPSPRRPVALSLCLCGHFCMS